MASEGHRSRSEARWSRLANAVFRAARARDGAALDSLDGHLRDLARRTSDPYVRGATEALRGVVAVAVDHVSPSRSVANLEHGSLAARLLRAIGDLEPATNTELARRLGTDKTQLSRAGARLRDLGLADRRRRGRENAWFTTLEGQELLARIGTSPVEGRRAPVRR